VSDVATAVPAPGTPAPGTPGPAAPGLATPATAAGPTTDPLAGLTPDQAARWGDLLAYVTDPDRPRPSARDDTPHLLTHLLTRAGIDESEFWGYARNRRSRVLRAG
jgi:hypothetical protein